MSSQEHESQGRRFFRAEVAVPVTIIVPGHELVLEGDSIDISRGGMRVSTHPDLPAGQSIILRFTLPGNEDELLVRGRVVLSFFDAASKRYAHGIAFTQYSSRDHERIAGFVSSVGAAEPK